ncbi:hypothetical protein [Shewanella surugensis]|uniref:Uncharacterized protein n=1 Tax=Shewanella surugensis TaxID=212020 RepID=A0ABT0L681_9GAMM|nr:hypothetical protein [Shewanella surugensis]MCL1123194.1 hypothetical protein [Shewanella surugensis]
MQFFSDTKTENERPEVVQIPNHLPRAIIRGMSIDDFSFEGVFTKNQKIKCQKDQRSYELVTPNMDKQKEPGVNVNAMLNDLHYQYVNAVSTKKLMTLPEYRGSVNALTAREGNTPRMRYELNQSNTNVPLSSGELYGKGLSFQSQSAIVKTIGVTVTNVTGSIDFGNEKLRYDDRVEASGRVTVDLSLINPAGTKDNAVERMKQGVTIPVNGSIAAVYNRSTAVTERRQDMANGGGTEAEYTTKRWMERRPEESGVRTTEDVKSQVGLLRLHTSYKLKETETQIQNATDNLKLLMKDELLGMGAKISAWSNTEETASSIFSTGAAVLKTARASGMGMLLGMSHHKMKSTEKEINTIAELLLSNVTKINSGEKLEKQNAAMQKLERVETQMMDWNTRQSWAKNRLSEIQTLEGLISTVVGLEKMFDAQGDIPVSVWGGLVQNIGKTVVGIGNAGKHRMNKRTFLWLSITGRAAEVGGNMTALIGLLLAFPDDTKKNITTGNYDAISGDFTKISIALSSLQRTLENVGIINTLSKQLPESAESPVVPR